MEINGIKIRDIKDVEDVLMALETIKNNIENVSDDMSNNYTNYKSLTEDISNQKELIEGISHLQIKAHDIIDNINTLNNDTKSINNNTINTIKREFESFDYQIQQIMSNVVNEIDLSIFRQQVETLFDNNITSLESEVERLNTNNYNLNKINNKMENTISLFNRLSKVVNFKIITASVLIGAVVGATLMLYFGINIAKDQLFKDEQIAINEYNSRKSELNARYLNSSKLEKIAIEYDISYTKNSKGRYISIPLENLKNTYRSDRGFQVWKLY